MQELEGKVAVVTGAGSGIGEATARLFAERGASVVVCDRDAGSAGRVADAIGSTGRPVLSVPTDVAEEDSLARMTDAVRTRFGRVDAIHANAAVFEFGDVLETSAELWDTTFAVNVRGAFLTVKHCLPLMIEAGGGAVCITASDVSVRTSSRNAAYVSSKHAVIGLARAIAVDFGRHGVRANAVSPGVTDTPGLRRIYGSGGRDPEEGLAVAAALSPLGRVARPEDVAEAVVFLCSPHARFITGEHLVVDGGMTVTYAAE